MPIAIADSAFLVNELRARNVALSRDVFAHLWVNSHTQEICQDYDSLVYPDDEIALGIRNRFFLELIESFFAGHSDATFVNIGSGFTNYPFLSKEKISTIEVDFPHVTEYKEQHIKLFNQAGVLPVRRIEFLGADLNDDNDRATLVSRLAPMLEHRPSLFLLEGLTYYLEPRSLAGIFQMAKTLQCPGSILAFDYWTPDMDRQPYCLKFRTFLEDRLGFKSRGYNYLSRSELEAIEGYRIKDTKDVLAMQDSYGLAPTLKTDYGVIDSYAVFLRLPRG